MNNLLRSGLPCIVAAMAAFPSLLFAAKVKVWQQHAPTHLAQAQFQGATLSSEGALRLARELHPLAELDAAHVWDIAEDQSGNLYAATGNEGKIYKLTADGKSSVIFAGEQSQVLCLAVASDGSVYAGTGPDGHILRIDPRGQVKLFCQTSASYVWSLAIDAKGQALYAGTGPRGKIYRITGDGKAAAFYDTRQEHVLCLAAGADGTIYAGTGKSGLVYRIDPRGKGFVLVQTKQAEVRTLKATPEAIYVGTSSPTRRRSGGGNASERETTVGVLDRSAPDYASGSKRLKDKKEFAISKSIGGSRVREGRRANPAPAPSTPGSGENSVYRIAPDGTVRELFREKAMILSLLRQNERCFAGTGMDGQLFEFNEITGERGEIARLDHGQIQCLLRRRDGSIVVGVGDPGKLYVLRDHFAARGTMLSEIFDAKIISKWGALRWKGETPEGTRVSVAARSGNVAEPDETWSEWSAEQTDAEKATIAAPPARFLQYRLTLATADPTRTPIVRGLTLRYATTNQAPRITRIDAPDLNAVNLDNPKRLHFKWSAVDANEDDLTYRFFIRKDGWANWIELEDDLEKTEYEWDTTTAPSGVYRVKIAAGDGRDNPESEALTGERISEPFIVCHTAPAVTVKTVGMEGDRVVLEATAHSPLVRLIAASFAVNGKKWINLFPADGLFDSKAETFSFRTEELKPGMYVVVVRVVDAAGNTGSADAVFTVRPKAAK